MAKQSTVRVYPETKAALIACNGGKKTCSFDHMINMLIVKRR